MEKEKLLRDISSTANNLNEQLKYLQLQMQSLIFQDATPERLAYIKKIVDEIENQTLKFQKMNVELNYVQNCYVEGMMPANLTSKDQEMITALPRYKRYQNKLSIFCENVENNLLNCDLIKRKSAFMTNISNSIQNKSIIDYPSLLGKFPQLPSTIIQQTLTSTTILVKVDEILSCLMRFEGAELSLVLIKGPMESFSENNTCGPEPTLDFKNKIDYFTPSKMKLFREITVEAVAFLSYLRSNYFSPSDQNHKFLEWLRSFSSLHSQSCFVCNRILSKNHLPPIRRDSTDFCRVLHDYC